MLRGSAPRRKRSKCWWTSQQAGGPPKPVAKPTVPSVASISTRKEPRTLMPHEVREPRYFSHLEQGVEMGESMSLWGARVSVCACVRVCVCLYGFVCVLCDRGIRACEE